MNNLIFLSYWRTGNVNWSPIDRGKVQCTNNSHRQSWSPNTLVLKWTVALILVWRIWSLFYGHLKSIGLFIEFFVLKKKTILCALAWACSFLLQPPFIMFQTILGCPASPVPNLVSSRFLMYYLYDYTLYSNTFRHWKSSILRLLWIEQNTFGYLYSWPFWPKGTERGLWEASAGRALKAKLNPLVKSRGACQCSILKGSRMVHWCW